MSDHMPPQDIHLTTDKLHYVNQTDESPLWAAQNAEPLPSMAVVEYQHTMMD